MTTAKRFTLEVFRPGTHTDSAGKVITFTSADLQKMADTYNAAEPSSRAPCVVGHPKTEDAAYGWIERLEYDAKGERLIAECGDIEPQFATLVETKRYPRVSMAFFGADHPSNPAPGVWFPRHLGFLGAAAPAITGLKSCAFTGAAGEVLFAEFGLKAADAWSVKQIFQRLRDLFIEEQGAEKGDRILPQWLIDGVEIDLHDSPTGTAPAYTATGDNEMSDTNRAEIDRLTAENARLTTRVGELETANKAAAFAARKADVDAFVGGLVTAKRLAPANVATTAALLLAQSTEPTLEFAAADGTTSKVSAFEAMKTQLSAAPVLLDTTTKTPADGGMGDGARSGSAFNAPAGVNVDDAQKKAHDDATAYQAKNPGVSFAAALEATGHGDLL